VTAAAELITLDIDWAPDFAIDFATELLAEQRVKATWFVTHASAAVERLAARPELFELGIHPNFAFGSTHGETPLAVLDHCLRLVPRARSMRAHSLLTSSPLLNLVAAETPLVAELSVFLPGAAGLQPVPYTYGGRTVYRIPFYWEDDYEFGVDAPNWDLADHLDGADGLRVFNFHPMHVYLNSCDDRAYTELKARSASLARLPEEIAKPLVHTGAGSRSLFSDLASHLAARGGGSRVIDIVAQSESPDPA
jgi:Polysaccharide deacetylase